MSVGRSLLIFFGALLFSVVLWSYVRLSNPYEADVDLPVKVSSPKGFALASGLPEHLHARVRGAGWQILLMNFTQNSRFQFDLAQRSVSDTTPLVLHSDEISHAVMVPSEVRLLKVDPDSLQLAFTKRIQKRLPIQARLEVTTGQGYVIVGHPTVIPATVLVEGSKQILDSLKYFPTKLVRAANVKEDVDQEINLSDSLDNMVMISNSQKVAVHVEVQAIGERVIRGIPVMIEALPAQNEILLIPSSVSVTIRGGVVELSKMLSTSVHARIPYDPLVFDTAKTVAPIVDVPAGTSLLGIEPKRVKFIIRRKPSPPNAAK